MSTRLQNHLRLYRRRSAFTQGELAFLLGYRTDSIVSRFERQERRIPLSIAFAYELIFGEDPKEIFPALLEQVQDGVVRRAYELHERLDGVKQTKRTATKLQVLQQALARSINRYQKSEV